MTLAIQDPIARDPGRMTLAKTSIPGPMSLATDTGETSAAAG